MCLVSLLLKGLPPQKLHFGAEMYFVKYFIDPVISLNINQLFLPNCPSPPKKKFLKAFHTV